MRLLTGTEVARRLGLSMKTFRKVAATLPGQVRLGDRVRFREDELIKFLDAGGQTTTTAAA